MKFCCIICSEYFAPTDDVSVTTCGHIFHHDCLFRWFKQNYNCPHCRKSLKKNRDVIVKLYFEHGPDYDQNSELHCSGLLSNKVNELEVQLVAANKELSETRSQILATKLTLSDLEKKCKDLEKTNARSRQNAETCKIKVEYLVNENKQINEIKRENGELKARIKQYDVIKKLVNDSAAEIEQMKVESSGGGKQWMVACGVLKKALNHANAENLQLKQRIKSLNVECQQLQKRTGRNMNNTPETKVPPVSTIIREESKSELPKLKTDVSIDEPKKLPGKENTCTVKIKASAVGANRTAGKSSGICIDDLNIMKRQKTASNIGSAGFKRTISLQSGGGYDGLGGHSKPDLFPNGRRPI